MKICERCDKPIQTNERYEKYDIPGASHAGTTVYLHARKCRQLFTRTTQA